MRTDAIRPSAGLILLLGLLEAFGPLSMDLYMPALPELARSLGIGDALAQTTMSVCMLGLGLGQLIAGPMSDRFGRRLPLLIGVAAFAVFSAACAVAPSVGWLLLFRALQGVSGAAGMVVTLAIARDIFAGARLARMLSWLALVGAVAPVVAPILGGQLSRFLDWRGIFWVLAGIGVLLLASALRWLPESHPRELRSTTSGPLALLADARVLLAHPVYRAVLVISAVSGAAFFAYLSMSSFVLQNGFGVTPALFGILFAAGSLCNVVGSQTNRVLLASTSPERLYLVGMVLAFLGSAVAAASALLDLGFAPFVAGLALYLASTGFTMPNASAIGLTAHGDRAGSAAALLGTSSLFLGPILAPLVSLSGVTAAVLGLTMLVGSALMLAVGLAAFGRAPRRP
ncbi:MULTISPECIES: multidrug effflux MFS transporter [unclassified Leucobacter]|uniref:multidrug effflux MFS transporter n=1 Tax=unclassified Leucobacter TaxID=2621730 RepID=UPI001F539BA3|nr:MULTISPECIES: multidrug effflux MFS transporter [unclassified Leucobacter]